MVQLVSFGRIGVVTARRRPARQRQRQRQRLLRLPVAAARRAARLEAVILARGGRHAALGLIANRASQ